MSLRLALDLGLLGSLQFHPKVTQGRRNDRSGTIYYFYYYTAR